MFRAVGYLVALAAFSPPVFAQMQVPGATRAPAASGATVPAAAAQLSISLVGTWVGTVKEDVTADSDPVVLTLNANGTYSETDTLTGSSRAILRQWGTYRLRAISATAGTLTLTPNRLDGPKWFRDEADVYLHQPQTRQLTVIDQRTIDFAYETFPGTTFAASGRLKRQG